VEWGYYQAHPLEIPQVWLGGLSGIGAILGALLALPIAAALFHEPAGALADRLLPLGAMVVVSSWLACWYAGCAYGVLVNTWWALPARDEGGAFQKRFPLQLIGAVLAVGSFWLLDRLYSSSKWLSRMRKGTTAVLGLFCFSLELFGLSFFRGDVFHPSDLALFWFGWRQDAWAALGLAITAGIGFIFLLAARYFEQKGEV
jgi:phosphatidylglycerol:prolipoprotein diacylglycerol transferase